MAGWYPDYLPGDIDGTGLLLGVPIGRLPLVEQSPTIQLVQQSPYLQLSGCTFSVEEEVAFARRISASMKRRFYGALTRR